MPAAEQKQLSMTPTDLQALVAAAVAAAVSEAKKPYIDPVQEAQKASDRARQHQQEEEARLAKEHRIAECTHQREDGSWNLNGQVNCLRQISIICGNCGGTFLPGDPQYKDLVKRINIPRLGNARN